MAAAAREDRIQFTIFIYFHYTLKTNRLNSLRLRKLLDLSYFVLICLL